MGVWLRDLPAALAGWGLDVSVVPGWQNRGHGPLLRSPRGVVNHWTATPFTSLLRPFPTTDLVAYGRADLEGPLCNLQLGFNGGVKIVAAGLAYHAGTGNRGLPMSGNSDTIGIECEGDGGYWSPQQLSTYPRINAALWRWYNDIKLSNLVAHFEWTTRKIDINTWPGGMGTFRASVQAQTKAAAVDTEDPQEEDEMYTEALPPTSGSEVLTRAVAVPVTGSALSLAGRKVWVSLISVGNVDIQRLVRTGPGVQKVEGPQPLLSGQPKTMKLEAGVASVEISYKNAPNGVSVLVEFAKEA